MNPHLRLVACGWIAGSVLGCIASILCAAHAAGPPSAWKVVDTFQISVEVYTCESGGDKPTAIPKETKPIASYVMHAVLLPVLPFEECGCWKLHFASFSKLPEYKDAYRLWIDKSDGRTRKGSRFNGPDETLLPPSDIAWIVLSAPPGCPAELIPEIESATFPTERAGTTLELSSRPIEGATERKAIIRVKGKPEIEIRQRWQTGAMWWSEYERFYRGQRDLIARLVTPKASPPPPAQTSSSPNDLRSDPRLQVPISAHLHHCPLQVLIDLISQKTSVELQMDEALAAAGPLIDDNMFHDFPAWGAMEILARDLIVEGRWERVEQGYRLLGDGPRRSAYSPAHGRGPIHSDNRTLLWRYLMALAPLLILGLLILFRRHRKAKQSATHSIDQRTNP
jgi:hypothetical protein